MEQFVDVGAVLSLLVHSESQGRGEFDRCSQIWMRKRALAPPAAWREWSFAPGAEADRL
jgi:hypothetical protein